VCGREVEEGNFEIMCGRRLEEKMGYKGNGPANGRKLGGTCPLRAILYAVEDVKDVCVWGGGGSPQ